MAIDVQPELLQRCLDGDRRAFRELVASCQQYAFALAFRIVLDEDEAKEIVQEAFIRVWKNLHSFDPAVRFTTWLYRIVVNLSYDTTRKRSRHQGRSVPLDAADEQGARVALEEETAVINRDLAAKIRAFAENLPPVQRKVFVLRDLQDLSVDETAEILSMSAGAVKTNLCYARRSIRKRMEQLEVPEKTSDEL